MNTSELTFHPKCPDPCVAVWALAGFMHKSKIIIFKNGAAFHAGNLTPCIGFWYYHPNEVQYRWGEPPIRLIDMVYIRAAAHAPFAELIVIAHDNVGTVVCVRVPGIKETFQTQLCQNYTPYKINFLFCKKPQFLEAL